MSDVPGPILPAQKPLEPNCMTLAQMSGLPEWKKLRAIDRRILTHFIEAGGKGEELLADVIVAEGVIYQGSAIDEARKFLGRADIQHILKLHRGQESVDYGIVSR